jgi:hypothetical protein
MDFSFHLHIGQQLLEKQDATSIKKALEHFKKANEMTEDEHIVKPKILYYLALGNYLIGNIEKSYKIAHKAKRSIDIAISNSIFSMDNMRQMLGEGDIDSLIKHIDDKFLQVVFFTDTDDDFDENELDFALVNQLYERTEKEELKPQFSIDSLDEEVLMATFFGLSRTNDELIYFDKLKGDVLSYVQGYFSSHIGDQSLANRRLVNRITNHEPIDFVDEDRYVLIDRLKLSEFLEEYKKQTKGKEPFSSFVEYFSVEVLKDFTYDDDLTIEDLANGNHIQEKFHELFGQKYQSRVSELRDDYTRIFQNTTKALAENWIKQNVPLLKENNQTKKSNVKLDFVFKSSDHLRYENGRHVSGPHGGARRAVQVEPNISGGEGLTVTLYNLDGNHPDWQNNVQMAPKQMKAIEQTNDKIVLRGYGHDAMGASFADYGLTIKLKNGELENCILHMHDRGVDIEYLP